MYKSSKMSDEEKEVQKKLLKEEQKLRDAQPERWTKTKYRKYATWGTKDGQKIKAAKEKERRNIDE